MSNPYAPPSAPVDDIAVAHTQSESAGRGIRLGAAILDGIIFGAMVYMPALLGILLSASAFDPEADAGAFVVPAVLCFAGFVVWAWLTIKYVRANGQSIAKRMLGIKVVRADGSPISLGRIFWLRNVVNTLLGFIPLYGLVDSLFIFGEEKKCLHDKLADTIVIVA